MKLVFAGTPEFAATILGALLGAGHDVALVLTQPDRPAGRGLQPQPSAVKRLAAARGLSVRQPAALTEPEVHEIREARPEAVVVAAYGLLLPPSLLALPPHGCVNVHASLLPRWRGAAPIQRALLSGDAETGISIMQMDAGLDTGPILEQAALPITATDTAKTLHDKLAALGARLIVAVLARRPSPRQQPAEGVTYARKLRKEEAWLDWDKPAAELERQVRALDPMPGAQTRLDGVTLKIRRALVMPGVRGEAGAIWSADAEGIVVACGQDGLSIIELQRAGGRPLRAREFLSGFKVVPGARMRPGNA